MQVCGGRVGEPALGPVAFMHRASALPSLLAPITHHWFDSTHITYGVVTGGLYGRRWKIEAWRSTIGWARNAEGGGGATNTLLVESSVTVPSRDVWYGRFEWAQKGGHDLAVPEHGIFDVNNLQGGDTRYLATWKGLTPGVGGALSMGIVPGSLQPVYGNRFNPGFSLYLTLRPAPHLM